MPKHQRKRWRLQSGEGARHQSAPQAAVIVQRFVAELQDAQAGLGIFRDAPLAPAADLLQDRFADQAHRPGEDDGVAFIADRHGHFEEIFVRVIHCLRKGSRFVIPVILRSLDEGHLRIGEGRNHFAQEKRVHLVIRVDHADEFRRGRGLGQGKIERAGLVPRPFFQVDEAETRPQFPAEFFDRPPGFFIRRIVVDDQHLVVGIIQGRQRPQRSLHNLRRFVVSRQVQRDHRLKTRRRIDPVDPVAPAHAAGHVDVFKHMGQRHQGGDGLNEEEHLGCDERGGRETGGNDDGISIHQKERGDDKRRQPGHLAEGIPIPQPPDADQPQYGGQPGEKKHFRRPAEGGQRPDVAQANTTASQIKRESEYGSGAGACLPATSPPG